MIEVTYLQVKILRCLLFPESYETVCEETAAKAAVVKDELKKLIGRNWVQVMEYDAEIADYKRTLYFQADEMDAQFFMITAKGLTVLEKVKDVK